MAEAGLENQHPKDASLLGKSEVSPDGVTKVVPSFVPSGTTSAPSGAISSDPIRAELLELVSKLTDSNLAALISVARKMHREN
jgi:hypothetical protein